MNFASLAVVRILRDDDSLYCCMTFRDMARARAYVQTYVNECGDVETCTRRAITFTCGVTVEYDTPDVLETHDGDECPYPECTHATHLMRTPRRQPKTFRATGDTITLKEICQQMGVEYKVGRRVLRRRLKPRPQRWQWACDDAVLDDIRQLLQYA